jgi:GNAT superfamily N-acetyltransferase
LWTKIIPPMITAFTEPRIVIRPTLPADTPDVLEFCKHIWDGHDYIPYVWNDWLADPKGFLFTAEYAGHAVGIARLAHAAPGQWWLEGLRVNPNFHDKKIGSALHVHLTEWWLAHGDGTVRLWTNAKRVKVHHLCEKLGFVHTQEHTHYAAQPLDEPCDSFQPVAENDIPAALDLVLTSPSLPLIGGMMDMGWRIVIPNETSLHDLLHWSDGHVWWWRGRRGLAGVWDDRDELGPHPMLSLAVSDLAGLPDLLLDLRRETARQGRHKIAWYAWVSPDLNACLASAGFNRESDDCNFQFEKTHPTRP